MARVNDISSFNRGTRTSIESIKYAIESMTENKKGLLALSPLLVFIVLYLVTSIVSGDFYKVPITVAFMISSIFAIAISGGFPLAKRIEIYSKGASTDNMMMMLWIFVLAGAFANSAKDMGTSTLQST